MKNISYPFAGLLSLRSRNMENLQWKTMLYSGFVVSVGSFHDPDDWSHAVYR